MDKLSERSRPKKKVRQDLSDGTARAAMHQPWNPNYKGLDDWQHARKNAAKGQKTMTFRGVVACMARVRFSEMRNAACVEQWHKTQPDGVSFHRHSLGLPD